MKNAFILTRYFDDGEEWIVAVLPLDRAFYLSVLDIAPDWPSLHIEYLM